jgi:hypothetical protein
MAIGAAFSDRLSHRKSANAAGGSYASGDKCRGYSVDQCRDNVRLDDDASRSGAFLSRNGATQERSRHQTQYVGAVALITLLWRAIGYSLVFTGSGDLIGGFDRLFWVGLEVNGAHFLAPADHTGSFVRRLAHDLCGYRLRPDRRRGGRPDHVLGDGLQT